MSLADLRDLFIVIFSIAGIAATVFLSIIAFLVYRRIRSILDSAKMAAANIRDVTSVMSENVAKPLASIASVLQGIVKVLEFITGPIRRREAKRGGRE